MKNTIWSKRFPSLAGIIVLVVAMVVTTFITRSHQSTSSNASYSPVPNHVQVSNATDTSLVISYTTQSQTTGTVTYGTNIHALKQVKEEEKLTGSQKQTIHVFTLTNLTPQTTYFFSITSDTTVYNNNGAYYTAKTGPHLIGQTSSFPISGKVTGTDGKALPDILVSAFIPGAQTMTALTQPDGSYTISLSFLRVEDLTSFTTVTDSTQLVLTATDGVNSATATVVGANRNPVPPITLSQTYDFSAPSTKLHTLSQAALPLADGTGTTSDIISLQDNTSFTDPQPTFKGTVNPNTSVTLTISPGDISDDVSADSDGNWQYQPSTPLAVGNYIISVTAQDPNGGADTTVERAFSILAQGSQVGESATPSATPTIEIPITTTPVPTVNISEIPTLPATPLPTQIVAQPTGSPLPPTGSNIILTTGVVGAIISGIGILLVLL